MTNSRNLEFASFRWFDVDLLSFSILSTTSNLTTNLACQRDTEQFISAFGKTPACSYYKLWYASRSISMFLMFHSFPLLGRVVVGSAWAKPYNPNVLVSSFFQIVASCPALDTAESCKTQLAYFTEQP